MKNCYSALLRLIILGVLYSTSANAALINRGGGLIYDTDLNLTWLQDTNYGKTTNQVGNHWDEAVTWASNLIYHDSIRNVNYDDWRLPTVDFCSGFNCTTSELGHMFHVELGGVAGTSIATTHNDNYYLFQNLYPTSYWPNTTILESYYAMAFDFSYGYQDIHLTNTGGSAWAVRQGDVAAVPLPTSIWLLSSGLIGLMGLTNNRI